MHKIIRAGPIGLEVRWLKRDDFIGLGEVREFREDVRLRATQINRGKLGPHLRGHRANLP